MSEKRSIWTKNFINISISTFFVFAVFYALLTFVPIYVLVELDGTPVQGGMAVSAFLLSAIIMRFFAGLILEKYGKRKILIFSVLMFAISTILYVFLNDFSMLLLLRFFHGIWFSLATTAAGAIVADIIPSERRGEGMGYYGIAMNLAVVAGPFLALSLQPVLEARFIFLLFGMIMVIGFLCAFRVGLKEETTLAKKEVKKRKMTVHDFLEKKSLPISSVAFLVSFAYASIITFISVYAESLGLIQTASFFFVVYAAAMLLVRPFTGRIFDAYGPSAVIIPSFIIFAIGLFSLAYTNSSWMLLVSGALVGIGYGTLFPSFQTLAIEAADKHRSGYATGTFFALFDTGVAIGAVSLGVIANLVGYKNLYLIFAVFVLAIIFYYSWIIKGHKKSTI